MIKFFRNYKLSVETGTGEILDITPPLTLQFSVERNLLAQANTARISVLNLNEQSRSKVYKDKFTTLQYKGVELRAGYGEDLNILPLIFKGNIKQAYSERQGTEYKTEIEAYDGGFAFINSYTEKSFAAGTPINQVLDSLMKDLPKVNKGAIGDFGDKLPRGNAYSGNTAQLLDTISGGNFFIDNEKACCLKDEECIEGNIRVISSESGLLGSPRRSETLLVVRVIFEPRILIGQLITLESKTERQFNGDYKVIGFSHRGIFSNAQGGSAETEISLYYGTKQLEIKK
jgi:hypothetical protein